MTATNDNRTHIYRIRRKADGLFLVTLCYGMANGNDPGTWGPVGVFWRKPETIREHLLELCQFRVYCSNGGRVTDLRRQHRGHRQQARDSINPFWGLYPHDTSLHHVATLHDHLDRYEVVATEITIHSQDTMTATEFILSLPAGRQADADTGDA